MVTQMGQRAPIIENTNLVSLRPYNKPILRCYLTTQPHFPFFTSVQCAQVGDWHSAKSIYEFSAKDIDGDEVSLEKYR